MAIHFQRELEKIKKGVLSLGAIVEERVHQSCLAIDDIDKARALKIIDSDYEIDEMEVELEEECLKVLALHQPVAVDLRFLVAVIKILSQLERIGDQAVNIAERIIIMAKQVNPGFVFDYGPMGKKAQEMLKKSLDSLVNLDLDMAVKVLVLDDEVDKIQRQAYDIIKEAIDKSSENSGYLINLLLISRHLERLADNATNIAEDVIYLIEGEIIRHKDII